MPRRTAHYEEDFFAWTQAQAALLREGKLHDLDVANLAEEIESLGKRDRREVGSRLEVLVRHLLKWHYQPQGRQTSHSWYDSIVEQRRELALVLDDSPSLRRQVPELLATGYARGRRQASHDTGLPLTTFPAECPWTPAQVLDDDFWPEVPQEGGQDTTDIRP
jgi:hypothetical protein